jgi:hypothetical protein
VSLIGRVRISHGVDGLLKFFWGASHSLRWTTPGLEQAGERKARNFCAGGVAEDVCHDLQISRHVSSF